MEVILSVTLRPFYSWKNYFLYPSSRKSFRPVNDFGVMAKRNMATSACVAKHPSLAAVQIMGTNFRHWVSLLCCFTVPIKPKDWDIKLIIIDYIICNSSGHTKVTVGRSRCAIAHHVLKAYGKVGLKLHSFLNSVGERGECWTSRLGRFNLVKKPHFPLKWRLSGLQSRWMKLVLTVTNLQSFQSVIKSRYSRCPTRSLFSVLLS
jgi:hypothetical protein